MKKLVSLTHSTFGDEPVARWHASRHNRGKILEEPHLFCERTLQALTQKTIELKEAEGLRSPRHAKGMLVASHKASR